MISEASLTLVQNSYGRNCSKPGFWDKFYELFLKSSPDVAEKFKNTNMARQKEILRGSLSFVLMYAKDPKANFAKGKLTDVGKVHSRTQHNIAPKQYDLWVTSLLGTLKHFEGAGYSPELEKAWKEVLAPAIQLMQSQY